MHIAVIGHSSQRDISTLIRLLDTLVARSRYPLMVEKSFLDYLIHKGLPEKTKCVLRPAPPEKVPTQASLVVSIGGDGTFMRAAHWVGDTEIPILGVNTGHLGYLASMLPDDISAIAEAVFDCPWSVQARSALTVEISGGDLPTELPPFALNEVAVIKEGIASILTCSACLDDVPLADYCGDGLLVATPTGSTAYNLSAGGPILQPTAPVLAISPVATHSLTMRPLVVADTSEVSIRVDSRAGSFRLSLDGISAVLPTGTSVTVRKASFPINIFLTPHSHWVQTLRSKLLWGVDVR